ncbi:MAG: hypothetical protein A2X94_17455 [Bdellovibrionales bacterium GWB1_55_8]|nr:MAG: hypothetical protein A2X94_17455 [Bdellovibrionales bacterium GWB1_55_8]
MLIKSILQGRFLGHPLHPIIVHLPVGLWVASFIMDIIHLASGAPGPAIASYYSILIGLVAVLLAAPTGLADFLSIPARTRPKRIAATHAIANVGITVIYFVNFVWRMGPGGSAPTTVTTAQFIVSLVSVILLSASGYLGGLLVYQYGVGYRNSAAEKRKDSRRAA